MPPSYHFLLTCRHKDLTGQIKICQHWSLKWKKVNLLDIDIKLHLFVDIYHDVDHDVENKIIHLQSIRQYVNLPGYVCTKFSTIHKSIMRIDGFACNDSFTECPFGYNSTESFKCKTSYILLLNSVEFISKNEKIIMNMFFSF